MNDIDPQKSVDYMIAKAGEFAQAEANKVYMEEMRKTIKAELMVEAEGLGHKTAAMQEREAYSSTKYKDHLMALREAVKAREELRWMLVAAQARIEVWKTQEMSNRRIERATL